VAAFEADLTAWLEQPDDFAARELQAAGFAVYYIDDDTPSGLVIKEFPDGRRQLVRGAGASQTVIRDL
jgi:hypothetical protein